MNKIKELEKILRTDVLVEVNQEIKALEELVLKNKKNEDYKIELEYLIDVKKYYDEVLLYIEKNKLTEEEAIELLEDLENMRIDDDEV